MFTLNKTYTKILVCAVDYFCKYPKMWKMSFLKKNHKKMVHKQKVRGVGVFSSRLDGFEIMCSLIRKTCTRNPYFLQKIDFCIFEPKNCEVIENSFKAPLSFSLLKCTHLGKHHFNNISAKSEKMKLKSGHLELHFSVYNGHSHHYCFYLCWKIDENTKR